MAGNGFIADDCVRSELERSGLELRLMADGLHLGDGSLDIVAEFSDMATRLAPGRLSKELLVRAAKVKGAGAHPILVDATAGLGEDSLLLAASGFEVTMIEANPIIAALLEDACKRARKDDRLDAAVSRMHLIVGNSVDVLPCLEFAPDVIYLDPMFPDRRKSAAVKKKFQLIHRLERHSGDEEDLLSAAIGLHPKKIVIKRPLKGPYLGDIKPSYSLRGKAVRYDVLSGV